MNEDMAMALLICVTVCVIATSIITMSVLPFIIGVLTLLYVGGNVKDG